jgi:hypothetical protein
MENRGRQVMRKHVHENHVRTKPGERALYAPHCKRVCNLEKGLFQHARCAVCNVFRPPVTHCSRTAGQQPYFITCTFQTFTQPADVSFSSALSLVPIGDDQNSHAPLTPPHLR